MNLDSFARAVRQYIHDPTVESEYRSLLNPPGRAPRQSHIELSNWFNALSQEDRDYAMKLVERGSHAAIFGVFCALDGARQIADFKDNGKLKLVYEDSNGETILADSSNSTDLHGAFQATFGEDIP